MQITINLPDKLTDEVQKQWGDLSQWALSHLILDAMKGGLITFDEFRESLSFYSEEELNCFLKQNHMLHDGGLLNLAGSCADIDLEVDDAGICDQLDDDLAGVFDE
ncbi:hypothetical protein PJF56_01445 [Roseofilum sp. BLCC_M91]|uniref:Uncharacterized protein n=1 Tax=Roseofilum halophilum BLCC-M91 TaxID=3022259 RepID=A0ABT7BFE1_9CYAN|nr:hypothetical protein [Roseofilum halophilum]MDJ1177517.1 hypothetical protein [Roseofilum halophilum BLCC-M91]